MAFRVVPGGAALADVAAAVRALDPAALLAQIRTAASSGAGEAEFLAAGGSWDGVTVTVQGVTTVAPTEAGGSLGVILGAGGAALLGCGVAAKLLASRTTGPAAGPQGVEPQTGQNSVMFAMSVPTEEHSPRETPQEESMHLSLVTSV